MTSPDLSTLPTAAVVAMRRPAATRIAANAELRRRLAAVAPLHATSEACAAALGISVRTLRRLVVEHPTVRVGWCRTKGIAGGEARRRRET